jgi:gluconate 2-dehydrogenase gamma chain
MFARDAVWYDAQLILQQEGCAMRRRHFLTLTGSTLGGLVVYSLDRHVWLVRAAQAEGQKQIRIPLRFFTETEALVVAAAVARIFPTDDSGPGAREAGVVIYIDRQLAGPYGADRHRYTQAPFDEDAAPELGYQGKATPREIYRQGVKSLQGLDAKPTAEQDETLQAIESTRFFRILRQNTIEGMFCDPLHGGNVDMVGWQLIGFPGPRMNNADDIEKHYGEAFRPKPTRLAEVAGNTLRGSEDER